MIFRIQEFFRQNIFSLCILLVIYGLSTSPQVAKLCAGVAILLFGMIFLSNGFRSFSGGFLEKVLLKFTKTTPRSITFGAVITTLMQSSSLVSVLCISFVSVSLISLPQGIGVMFGANLGNTAGSWLIAGASSINISVFALPLIVGGLLFNFQNKAAYKGIGQVLSGLGFFFLGVFYIKEGFEGFSSVLDLSQYDFGALGFMLVGALVTAIIQSSHATLAIIIAAFLAGQISYKNALACVLGTSAGGVVTALVASLSTNAQGRKLALANCVFNFVVVALVMIFFDYFVLANDTLAALIGIGASSSLRLALFHTIFNVFGVALLSFAIPFIAQTLDKIFDSRIKNESAPMFINDSLLPYTDTAIHALGKEVWHLYQNAFAIIAHTIGFHRHDIREHGDLKPLLQNYELLEKDIAVRELYNNDVKSLFNVIIDFSTKLQACVTQPKDVQRIMSLQIASRKIAEATKNIELLQDNIKKYTKSNNQALKSEYNNMRLGLANLLALIEQISPASLEVEMSDKKADKKTDKKASGKAGKKTESASGASGKNSKKADSGKAKSGKNANKNAKDLEADSSKDFAKDSDADSSKDAGKDSGKSRKSSTISQEKITLKDIKKMLKAERKFFKQQDKYAITMAETLIAQNKISSANSTSLLNDFSFVNTIAKELISAINHIYGISGNKSI
ncbi:hypothetical protein BKN38_07540 [Helicobacter sp. CLO-3]|uniref:Na/Pi cotransporter family protein n=1 Tax=unclassified Helicobacter TaxID=2593540 RepID=UPI0008055DEE|nr:MULTISPECIES: Na/Pi symporter [unclassified Helicobacter]OBV28865.1 hypothetical protein BA723_07855 [Helicobacter sp. CLO-3]OHU82280.1 hypothetical protein BKN38_07540 [Helicobacter sp. CLO-3]